MQRRVHGSYKVFSPLNSTKTVTSPPRYHDGCEPYTTHFSDSPNFDNPSVCVGGVSPAGDWAMDISQPYNGAVYIDVEPGSIDGFSAGSTFRVVAGTQSQWDGSSNGDYQYFGVHVLNPNNSQWENYAWILIGHTNFWYAEATQLGDSAL